MTTRRRRTGLFTGIDWELRGTEQLSRDLLGGAGAEAYATAAQETARLAAYYGTAAAALDRLSGMLDGALITGDQPGRATPLSGYSRWLAEHAAEMSEYATALAGQAAAYESAARTMPGVAEVERVESDHLRLLRAAEAGGAESAVAAIAGAAIESERAQQQAHQRAVAAMIGYERSSAPLSEPWGFHAPPAANVTRSGEDRKAAGGMRSGGANGTGTAVAAGSGATSIPLSPYAIAPILTESREHARPVVSTAPSSSITGRPMPMMPAGMLGATGAARPSSSGPQPQRGALEAEETAPSNAFVVHATPDVLGGTEVESTP